MHSSNAPILARISLAALLVLVVAVAWFFIKVRHDYYAKVSVMEAVKYSEQLAGALETHYDRHKRFPLSLSEIALPQGEVGYIPVVTFDSSSGALAVVVTNNEGKFGALEFKPKSTTNQRLQWHCKSVSVSKEFFATAVHLVAGTTESRASTLRGAVDRCGLTWRSTGRATAWHPGRATLSVHVAPRGQGPMPSRAGYLYVRQHMGSGKFHGSSRRSARSHPCQPCRAWTGRLCAPASSQSHAARLPAPPCSHPAASNGCAAGSLTSTIYSLGHPRSALPNLSVNRSLHGMAPWPRCALCPCCASRPGRHAVPARLPLR
jgi:hypothetical protein